MGWKNKKEEVHIQCSLIKSPIVFLEPIPKCKIELLMNKYPHQEWLGYLVGRVSEKENYFVEDLSVPPHKEVSSASAEAEPFHIPDRCIGVIHSHHSMGAFHSGTDQSYVDKNFPVSLTVAKKNGNLEYDTVSYQTTPCGKSTTLKATVKYVQPEPPLDTEVFLKEATGNIDKGKKVYVAQQCQQGRYSYGQRLPLAGNLSYSDYEDTEYYVAEGGRLISQKEIKHHTDKIWRDR